MGLANFELKPPRLLRTRADIAEAHHLDVLVNVREPVARATSYFLYRNRARIGGFHDPAAGGIHDAEAIARDLRAFCRIEARRQAVWFREELGRTLDCGAEELARGPIRRDGLNVFLIRCETAARDMLAAGAGIGPVTIQPSRSNGAAELGLARVARDFARAFPLPRRLVEALEGRGDITRFYPAPAAPAAGPLPAAAELVGEEGRGFGP
jgi:hypothetical protein